MSLFQEIAAHGLAYCEYNQALLNIENLNDEQKIQIVKHVLEDQINKINNLIENKGTL
jgi:hypothetical protein